MRDHDHPVSMDDPDDEPLAPEGEVMELAADLLEAAGRQGLDRFFDGLVERAACCRGLARSPVGRALARGLAGAAARMLPPARRGGSPALAPGAGHALGLELEGLSAEDREFEAAKQLVLLAGAAVRRAGMSPPGDDPVTAARHAIAGAASALAPGLPSGRAPAPAASGRWVRRGHHIVIEGA